MGHSYKGLEVMLRAVLPRMGVTLKRAYRRAADLDTPIGCVMLVREKHGTTWRCVTADTPRKELCKADSSIEALDMLIERVEKEAVGQLAAMIRSEQDG